MLFLISEFGIQVVSEHRNVLTANRRKFRETVVGIGNHNENYKGQFDEVLRRMLEKLPQKTSEIHKKEKPRALGRNS